MNGFDRLLELCRGGRMRWTGHGWIAEPDEVMEALARGRVSYMGEGPRPVPGLHPDRRSSS